MSGEEKIGKMSNSNLEKLNVFLEWKYLSFAVYIFAFSQAIISFITNNTNWFSSSGAVIAVIGLFLTIKNSVLKTKIELESDTHISDDNGVMAELFELTNEFKQNKRKEAEIESRLEFNGVKLSVVGTLIWAYGFCLPTIACITNVLI